MATNDLLETAKTVITTCLQVQRDELVLVITDTETGRIGQALWMAAGEVTHGAVLCQLIPGRVHGEEPPAHVGIALETCDVGIMATRISLL